MKTKNKFLIIFMLGIMLFCIPNFVNAANTAKVECEQMNQLGVFKYTISGETFNTEHAYKFALTRRKTEEPVKWFEINQITESNLIFELNPSQKEIFDVMNYVDIGYLTIKDETATTEVLTDYEVNLRLHPFKVVNHRVLPNGFDASKSNFNVPIRNSYNTANAYFAYEKVTDENIINKYKEIKAGDKDWSKLQSILPTEPNTKLNYAGWDFFNGYGFPTKKIEAPSTGLYYLWFQFDGKGDPACKDIYAYTLVDNLEADIALNSISIPERMEVGLDETGRKIPITFNPASATNKIVTWTSSDESVAKVNNAGEITPIKVGSTIITVTSEDGTKTSKCTLVVKEKITDSGNQPGNKPEEKKFYINFPMFIMNGKGKLSIKSYAYDGPSKLYYQYIILNNEQYDKIKQIENKYKNGEITNDEIIQQLYENFPKYDDAKWVETKNGEFVIDTSAFDKSEIKKVLLWAKAKMGDKVSCEATIYEVSGTNKGEKDPVIKDTTSKDDTLADKNKLPFAGHNVITTLAIAVISIMVFIFYKGYKKYIKI